MTRTLYLASQNLHSTNPAILSKEGTLLAGRFGFQLREGARDLLVFSIALGPAVGPTSLLTGVHSGGVNRPGSEADHTLPSSAEV